jgi:hypothetical protein
MTLGARERPFPDDALAGATNRERSGTVAAARAPHLYSGPVARF